MWLGRAFLADLGDCSMRKLGKGDLANSPSDL